jgi:hypothetical protein
MEIGTNLFVCSVCKSRQSSLLMKREVAHPLWWMDDKPDTMTLRYVICEACGYIQLHPHLSQKEYDEIYRLTPGLDLKTLSEDRKKMLHLRKAFILKHADELKNGTVIEAGPAYGDFLVMFDSFKRRIGIEPSETYHGLVAKERPELEYYSCLLEDFLNTEPGFKECADLVTACHVLEHAFNPSDFIKELSKLVNQSGYLFIEVPSIEGMSEIEAPLYQNLYFGHVSQFSTSVITRIGVQAGLSPIYVEYTATNHYPVIRALFRKNQSVDKIRTLFFKHAENIEKLRVKACSIFTSLLLDDNKKHILVWGCGQDLLDIISSLKEKPLEQYQQKVLLSDRNPGKQQRFFRGVPIELPEANIDEPIDVVVIPSRSQLICIDIGREASALFPDAKIVYPYKNERG